MLSSNVNEAGSGVGREQVPGTAGLPQRTQRECKTEVHTQVAIDEISTQTAVELSWDEVVEEWFTHGTELMIF